ncbi:MAG: hypothetical protein E6R13_03905 [Spirochaetes bacterium]|nr:MAG: hypothetical protein E6R13_03905 [Spirochaetota bacterium]
MADYDVESPKNRALITHNEFLQSKVNELNRNLDILTYENISLQKKLKNFNNFFNIYLGFCLIGSVCVVIKHLL